MVRLQIDLSHLGSCQLESPLCEMWPIAAVCTCQHGDERQCVVFRRAPVPRLAQQVVLQHLVVELLDPGLRQNHQDSAALDQTHKLLLQKHTHTPRIKVDLTYCRKSSNTASVE